MGQLLGLLCRKVQQRRLRCVRCAAGRDGRQLFLKMKDKLRGVIASCVRSRDACWKPQEFLLDMQSVISLRLKPRIAARH